MIVTPDSPLQAYTELCRNIKFGHRKALVPVIFIVAPELASSRAGIFKAGADDCIQLPASHDEIVQRILNAVRVRRATDSLEDASKVVTILANAIEGRDAHTLGHVERVAVYAAEVARHLGLSPELVATVRTGAIVHDIGKIVVPDRILNKPGKLTDEEFAIMRRHPVVGHDMLEPMRTFRDILPIVRWHHERPNGTGYPDGLMGEEIPLVTRIVAVADFFDAIGTDRPYRKALSASECKDLAGRCAADGSLDPRVVAALFTILDAGELTAVDDAERY